MTITKSTMTNIVYTQRLICQLEYVALKKSILKICTINPRWHHKWLLCIKSTSS